MAKTVNTPFKQDVQGLRAIGAILVAAFHIWEGGVSGGVDIFFVVSGYFLGKSYLQLLAKDQSLSAVNHFSRFVNRTVPQVLMVLTFTLILAVFFQSPLDWHHFLRDFFYSALYFENYALIQQEQIYLFRGMETSLLQHFWAVSLIAQVYALWFFVVWLSDFAAKHARIDRGRTLRVFLSTLILTSLAWSLYYTAARPTAAYFEVTARFWQFGIGAMLSLMVTQNLAQRVPSSLQNALSWLGLGLVLTCGLLIGSTAAFPGYASIWPVGAAALLLMMSIETRRLNAGSILSSRLLVWLGTYSFGIYLWHWPIYIVVLRVTGETPSIWLGTGIILLGLLLAFLSEKFTAFLMKRATKRVSKPVFALGCVVLLVGYAGFAVYTHKTLNQSVIARAAMQAILGEKADLTPGPFATRSNNPDSYRLGCHQNQTSSDLKRCTFGPEDAKTQVMLVGGSHSAHWLPALQAIAQERDWRVVSITKSACLFANPEDKSIYEVEGVSASCSAWNTALIEALVDEQPDMVVTLATRPIFADPSDRNGSAILGERIPDGYVSYFQRLADAGVPTVAIRDTPWMEQDVPSCVYQPTYLGERSCDRKRTDVLDDSAVQDQLPRLPAGTAYIDMSDAMCDDNLCQTIRDGMLMYRDSNHITATYSRHLGPRLAERIDAALKREGLQINQ